MTWLPYLQINFIQNPKIFVIFVLFKWATFCLVFHQYSLYLKESFEYKTVVFSGIQTLIVGVDGEHADH